MSWLGNLADTFLRTATSALTSGAKALINPGAYLRDDLPAEADEVTKWIHDRNRRACRRHARNEAAGLYSDLGALRRPRYGHCKPYLDSIGEGPTSSGSYGPLSLVGNVPGLHTRSLQLSILERMSPGAALHHSTRLLMVSLG